MKSDYQSTRKLDVYNKEWPKLPWASIKANEIPWRKRDHFWNARNPLITFFDPYWWAFTFVLQSCLPNFKRDQLQLLTFLSSVHNHPCFNALCKARKYPNVDQQNCSKNNLRNLKPITLIFFNSNHTVKYPLLTQTNRLEHQWSRRQFCISKWQV